MLTYCWSFTPDVGGVLTQDTPSKESEIMIGIIYKDL